MPLDKTNNNLIYEIIERYRGNQMEEKLTISSTGPILVVRINIPPGKVDIKYTNDVQVAKALGSLIKKGYMFSVEDVSRTVSIHQNRLEAAKAKLLNEVLKIPNTAYARQDAILQLGTALNYQIDSNPMIHGKRNPDNIYVKLPLLGLESDNRKLYEKYKSLNKYYNAVKHQGSPENRRNADKLKGTDGLAITIDFFETVRRLFRWYYKKFGKGIPDWDELKPIHYLDFNKKYRFRYEKLW